MYNTMIKIIVDVYLCMFSGRINDDDEHRPRNQTKHRLKSFIHNILTSRSLFETIVKSYWLQFGRF